MLVSYSTCQQEEKQCICIKYVIYASLSQLQFSCNLRVFSRQILIPRLSELTKKLPKTTLLLDIRITGKVYFTRSVELPFKTERLN